eukprot:4068-Heterococcus_DN1.PRE.1
MSSVVAVAAFVQPPCASLTTNLASVLTCSKYLYIPAAAPASDTTAATVLLLSRAFCSMFAIRAAAALALAPIMFTVLTHTAPALLMHAFRGACESTKARSQA